MVKGIAHTNRRIRSIVAALSLVATLVSPIPTFGAGGESVAGQLHRAASAPERALNTILKVQSSEQPGNMHLFDFLTDYKGARRTHEKMFGRYFSSTYLDAVAAYERELVIQNCGGEYVEGDMCGLDRARSTAPRTTLLMATGTVRNTVSATRPSSLPPGNAPAPGWPAIG